MLIIKIILAILLPPVAAYLQVGFTKHFFINLLLTFFFFVPGVIYAVYLVATDKKG